MTHFRPVELMHASRLLNHGPTVLITSRDDTLDRRNVMAAAWSMPVEFEPPRIAIVVDKSTWSRELIERSGMFGIVIPGVAAANWTWAGMRINSTATVFRSSMARCWACRLWKRSVWRGWSAVCCPQPRQQKSMTPCLVKWSLPRRMNGRLSPGAGSLTTISLIPCTTWARAPL